MIELGLTELCVAAISFAAGRFFVQSENILEKKKEVYCDYLSLTTPVTGGTAQKDDENENLKSLYPNGEFRLFASRAAIVIAAEYALSLSKLCNAQEEDKIMANKTEKLYNRLVSAMRRDVLGFSIQGFTERTLGDKQLRNALEETDK